MILVGRGLPRLCVLVLESNREFHVGRGGSRASSALPRLCVFSYQFLQSIFRKGKCHDLRSQS